MPLLYLHMLFPKLFVFCFQLDFLEISFSHYYICFLICTYLVLKAMFQRFKLNLAKNAN